MRLLDAFCCAGGAGVGYHRAGFDEVVGVDINPKHGKNYPFEFHAGDAIEFIREHGHEFDAIHASPPCQIFTRARNIKGTGTHVNLIPQTREVLDEVGKPYAIENVDFSDLYIDSLLLCGTMFPGLKVYRHRLFETPLWLPLTQPDHPKHTVPLNKLGRRPEPGQFMHVVGNFIGKEYAEEAMGIDWMSRDELREAIPPAYTEYVGRHLLEYIDAQTT